MNHRLVVTLVAVLAGLSACGKKKDKDAPPGPGTPPATAKPGADTAEAAAKGVADAVGKGDLAAMKRMIPDADACKVLPDIPNCDGIGKTLDEKWAGAKTMLAAYASATVAKSTDPAPFKGAELWTATVAGTPPLLIITMAANGRHFGAFKLPADPKAPSTGNEMPGAVAMTPQQAMKGLVEIMKLAQAPTPDCDKIADELMVVLPVAYPTVTKEAAAPYQILMKCSLATKRWRSAVQAGVALLPVAPEKYTVAQIVRALVEMGEYDKALGAAADLVKKFPQFEESLVAATVFAFCKAEAWEKCLKTSEQAIEGFTKAGLDPKSEGMLLNRLFRDMAWVVTGKPKQALDDLAELEKLNDGKLPPMLEQLRQGAQKTVDRGFYLEVVPMPQLPTGIYHLMGRAETGALVTLKMHEHSGSMRTLRVEAEIAGVTERSSNSLVLNKNESTVKYLNPAMKMDFDVNKIRSPRPAQLAIKITEETAEGPKTIVEETLQIQVLPKDYLPLRRLVGADSAKPTYGYLGAWITSNDKAIEEFLTKAKQLTPTKEFVGEQNVTVPQVKALFDGLKATGVSYVMDPSVTSMQSSVQRTRLPAEVLASTNAQCLEGTLLFATLLEAIGVKPIIVLVPGHAFVGWKTVAADGTKGEPLFVETTMISGATFEQAVRVATQRVAQEFKVGSFKTGASTMIDVSELRAKGFTAQSL